MKVLHVIETLSPCYGGPVSVLVALATAQQRAGHDVTIATTNSDHPRGILRKPGWDILAEGNVPVYYASVQFEPLRFSWPLGAYLRRALAGFDLIHIHGLYRYPPTYAAWLARRNGIPYIVTPHGALDPYLYARSSTNRLFFKRCYERLFDLPNLHNANAIHFTAEEERARASFLNLKAPSFVVPVGLNWAHYRDLPARGTLRARLGLEDAPMVLFLGRLHFVKGLYLLIPAFDALRRRIPDVQLVIAGPDNDGYGEKVKGWVRDRGLEDCVAFIGTLFGEEVLQAYVDADVFVLPSYTENFGMTVVEAMACKTPVVISDRVNIHREVAASEGGLVTACDADQVANALVQLLENPDLRQRMGTKGRRYVQEHFTWDIVVDQLTRVYERILAGDFKQEQVAGSLEKSA